MVGGRGSSQPTVKESLRRVLSDETKGWEPWGVETEVSWMTLTLIY